MVSRRRVIPLNYGPNFTRRGSDYKSARDDGINAQDNQPERSDLSELCVPKDRCGRQRSRDPSADVRCRSRLWASRRGHREDVVASVGPVHPVPGTKVTGWQAVIPRYHRGALRKRETYVGCRRRSRHSQQGFCCRSILRAALEDLNNVLNNISCRRKEAHQQVDLCHH